MLDPTKLPDHIKADIAANRGWDAEPEITGPERDARISRLDARQALDFYLSWHGLIGWAGTILSVVVAVLAAETSGEPE